MKLFIDGLEFKEYDSADIEGYTDEKFFEDINRVQSVLKGKPFSSEDTEGNYVGIILTEEERIKFKEIVTSLNTKRWFLFNRYVEEPGDIADLLNSKFEFRDE